MERFGSFADFEKALLAAIAADWAALPAKPVEVVRVSAVYELQRLRRPVEEAEERLRLLDECNEGGMFDVGPEGRYERMRADLLRRLEMAERRYETETADTRAFLKERGEPL